MPSLRGLIKDQTMSNLWPSNDTHTSNPHLIPGVEEGGGGGGGGGGGSRNNDRCITSPLRGKRVWVFPRSGDHCNPPATV